MQVKKQQLETDMEQWLLVLLLLLNHFRCVRLCHSRDSSPPASPVPGILQARTLEWVALSFSNAWKWRMKVKSLSHARLPVTPWTAAYRLLHPWDFSGKSTGVGCHCLLEQWTASKLGKEYIQTIYCYLVYLTYMQNTLCECRTGWSTSWNQDCWEKYQ